MGLSNLPSSTHSDLKKLHEIQMKRLHLSNMLAKQCTDAVSQVKKRVENVRGDTLRSFEQYKKQSDNACDEWNKKADYVGKKALEKMKDELQAGKKPYKLQLVGLEFGGKPVEDYAPDFWLISPESGGDPVGFITSPWYHPEKKQNIAMGYVPFDGTLNANGFPKGKVGTKFKVHLPEQYSDTPGTPVDAVVVDIPFKESFNANTREVVKG